MNKIRVHNVRFGLATNSSSSHSLIFLNEPTQDQDLEIGKFGWNFFTAAERHSKCIYLSILLRKELENFLPNNVVRTLVESWARPQTDEWLDDGDWENAYIDHQSTFPLPYTTGSHKFVNEQFFRELYNFFMQDNFAILGGNDNEYASHHLDNGSAFTMDLPYDRSNWRTPLRDRLVARKDETYGHWTLFDPKSGNKVRFTLGQGNYVNGTNNSESPELVDVKITDFCPFNCDFCYQDSTLDGVHAEMGWYNMGAIIESLEELGVFEVALGGGEPTMHPNFCEILENFRKNGIVPNFTTRNIAWLRDPEQCAKILEHAGNFAFSVSNKKDIKRLCIALDASGVDRQRVAIHVVMGTVTEYNFGQIYKACGENELQMTLLGYKTTGRGENVEPIEYDWWLNDIQYMRMMPQNREADGLPPNYNLPHGEITSPRVSVDTVLAEDFEEEIIAANIPPWMFHTQDGKFSCYIDAVSMRMGPSSYCGEDEMLPLDARHNELTQQVQEYFSLF